MVCLVGGSLYSLKSVRVTCTTTNRVDLEQGLNTRSMKLPLGRYSSADTDGCGCRVVGSA